MQKINPDTLAAFHAKTDDDKALHVNQAALFKEDIRDVTYIGDQGRKLNGAFTIDIPVHGITAQRNSGRCWLFAALNLLREETARKLSVDAFEFSENYLAFFDKLEKANNFLESIIRYADEPLDSRHNSYVLNGIGDGNVWTHAVYLLKNYGAVPKEVMPETYQSEHTDGFLKYVNVLLRKDAAILRKHLALKEDVSSLKEKMLAEIWKMEVMCFGNPPVSFDYAWRDTDGQYHELHDISPVQFLHDFTDTDLDEYVHVINEPVADRDLYRRIIYHSNECAVDEDRVRLNLPMDDLEEQIIASLKDGKPVWFGCESRAWMDRKEGIFDPDSFSTEDLFSVTFEMDKGDSLQYHAACAAHNMLLTGVHLDAEGHPDRWKIENSWGEEAGKKGIFVCSEKYFRQFVFEAAVDKKYLNERQLNALNEEPLYLEPWQAETLN